MRAVVHDRYGPPDVLRLEEVERPLPKDDEVLVRVRASSVTRSDCGVRSAEYVFSRAFTGLVRPKQPIVGMEFAGVVDEVGSAVTQFAAGDEVFGVRSGSNAEYVCVRESGVIAHKPSSLSFEEAAGIPDGALSALTMLPALGPIEGRHVVVYGAAGSIGSAAVQVAKHLGARVTAVCGTTQVELVRSLGADDVVDYLHEDWTRRGTYDGVFDAIGKSSFRKARRALKPGAAYVSADLGYMWHLPLLILPTRWLGSRKVKLGLARYRQEDLVRVRELIDAGAYRAVIDRSYPLEDVVDATKYVETGQKTGNVVLTIDGGAAR
ncbi:MAG: NAD(P)-dependent alcohol dehydrogenase [Gaiellaceae bacterium]